MTWKLEFDPAAAKELSRLDKAQQRTVIKYLDECCSLEDPADRGHALTGQWAGFHRYRIGQLRIIVKIIRGQMVIMTLRIGRRDSIY